VRTTPPILAGLQGLVAGLGALLVLVWLAPLPRLFQGLGNYLPLHSLVEVVSIVIAALVFGVVWNAYSHERSGNLVLLACALLAVALIDFAHALSYAGMPEFVTPSDPEKAIFFWLAAPRLAAISSRLSARPGP